VRVLAPDEADLVMRAIDCAREREVAEKAEVAGADVSAETGEESPARPSRADGAVTMAEAFLAGGTAHGSGGDRYPVMVQLDQDVLGPDGMWAATLDDNRRCSAETLRWVACDCGLAAVICHGEPLDEERLKSIDAD
jgi:hypothetical protein